MLQHLDTSLTDKKLTCYFMLLHISTIFSGYFACVDKCMQHSWIFQVKQQCAFSNSNAWLVKSIIILMIYGHRVLAKHERFHIAPATFFYKIQQNPIKFHELQTKINIPENQNSKRGESLLRFSCSSLPCQVAIDIRWHGPQGQVYQQGLRLGQLDRRLCVPWDQPWFLLVLAMLKYVV